MSLQKLFESLKGGAGSGNWGHAGVPGKRGGSSPRSFAMSRTSGRDYQERQAARKGKPPAMDVREKFESLPSYESYPIKSNEKGRKNIGSVEYKKDQENRSVIAKVDNKGQVSFEETKVGDYFKSNDADNFDAAITSHRNQYSIRNDVSIDKNTKVTGASSIERARRSAGRSASAAMRRQRK